MPSFDFRSLFTTQPERQLVPGLGATSEWRIKPTSFAEDGQDPRFPAFQQAWKQGAGLTDLFGPEPFELHGTVAPSGGDNHRPDVAKVQTLLGKAGYVGIRDGGPNGYPSDVLDSAIRQFQQDQGLTVDGVLKPGGPTITALGGLLGGSAQPQAKPAPQKGLFGEFNDGTDQKLPGGLQPPPKDTTEDDMDVLLTILNGGKPPEPTTPVIFDENQFPRPVPPLGGPWPDGQSLPKPPGTVLPQRPEDGPAAPVSRVMEQRPSAEQQAEYQAAYQKWVQDNWDTIQKNKELKAMGLPPLPVPAPPRDPRERDPLILNFAPDTKVSSTFDPQAEAKRWVDWSREDKRKKDQDILSRLGQGKPADPYPDHTISEDGAFEHDKYAENLVRDSNPHETARYLKNVIAWNGDTGRGDVADLLGRFAKIDEAKAKERIPFRIAPLIKDSGGPMADLAEGETATPIRANPFGSAEGADRWEAGNMARALLGKSDYQDAITHFKGEVAKDRTAAMPYLAAVHEEMAASNPELAGKFASQMEGAGLTMKEEQVKDEGGDDTPVGGTGADNPPQGQTEGAQGDNGDRQEGGNDGQANENNQTSQSGQTAGEQVAEGGGEKPEDGKPSLPPPTNKPIDPQALYEQLGYQHDGSGDYGNAIKHPLDAIRAKEAAAKASEAAEKEYADNKTSLGNGEGDAFRHALWSYKMAKEVGDGAAKAFGEGHERDGQPDGGRLMDLYNNAVGRELAADPRNKDRPDEEVIREAIKAGKLQTRPFSIPASMGGSLSYPPRR